MFGDHCSEDVLQENGYNTTEICLEVNICPEEWILFNINECFWMHMSRS
jgi:hypothetical protein